MIISFEELKPVCEYINYLNNLYTSLRKLSDFRFIEYRWKKAVGTNQWSGFDIETDIIIDDLHLFEFFEDDYWRNFFHLHSDSFLEEFEKYVNKFRKFYSHWRKNIYKEYQNKSSKYAWAQTTTLVLEDLSFKSFVFETKFFCDHFKKEFQERFLLSPLPLKVENKFYHTFDEVDWVSLDREIKKD